MSPHYFVISVLLLVSLVKASPTYRTAPGPYIDRSNPYHTGSLTAGNVTLTTKSGAPMHTTVIYPRAAGIFPVIYFVAGGPSGIIPSEWYSDILTRVVSHGFIALAVDPFFPAIKGDNRRETILGGELIQRHLHHLEWLKSNLQKALNLTQSGMIPLTERVGLLCHSAGCDDTLQMIQSNSSIATSTLFLEPFSINIKKMPGIKMPAYMYGTQFSEEYGPFPCSIPGVDYNTFYEQWGCPKWMTEVANFGHCDVLDAWPWSTCHIGHFCKTVGDWSRVYPVYHEYAAGAISSFYIGTLQGYTPALHYIEDRAVIPLRMLNVTNTPSC